MVAALTARLADELVVVLEHAAAKKSVERPPRAQARLAALAAVIGI
jgi:hypothetical protein